MVSPPTPLSSTAHSTSSPIPRKSIDSGSSSFPQLAAGALPPGPTRFYHPPNGHPGPADRYPQQHPGQLDQRPQYDHQSQSHTPYSSTMYPNTIPPLNGYLANPDIYQASTSPHPLPGVPQYIPPPQHQLLPDPTYASSQPRPGGAGPGQQSPEDGWDGRSHLPRPPDSAAQSLGQQSRGPPIHNGGAYGGPSLPRALSVPRGWDGPAAAVNRPGSGAGRRRGDRDEEGGEEEVISTIFVVGFPDDMMEREFQNIFTFAQGFEAATLKYPSGSRHRDQAAALLAELNHVAAIRESSRSRELSREHEQQLAQQQQGLEEALAALNLSAGVSPATASTSTSTTPSAAISLTPNVQSGPTLGVGMGATRRQTIGFARFKTRADALLAKEQLQGRKIDYLTGAMLKAEMAKKNLHLGRPASGEELGFLSRSGRLGGLVGGLGGLSGHGSRGASRDGRQMMEKTGETTEQGGPRRAWEAWPDPLHGHTPTLPQPYQPGPPFDSRQTHPPHPDDDAFPPHLYQSQHPSSGAVPASNMSYNSYPPTNAPHHQPSGSQYPSSSAQNFYPPSSTSQPSTLPSATSPPSAQRSSISDSLSSGGPSGPSDSKALLAFAEEADELEMEMEWSAMNGGLGQDRTPRRAAGYTGYGYAGDGPLGFGRGGRGRGEVGVGPTSPTGTNEALSDGGRSMGNPADQNPPINTLYIGNLPAVSPPTHPPSFLEDSLRGLFAQLPGYKRMSFRQKINGPMCFVEFEDVGFATMAIKEVYGHNLNGLVKGGIRLSYSKNSLGQRGQSHQPQTNTMYGGIAHTVALAGMSTPAGSNGNSGSAQSFSSLGLSRNNENRDGTTLSPTAQPFTIPPSSTSSSSATSPRSRYFASPSSGPSEPRSVGYTADTAATPIPGGYGQAQDGAASPARSPGTFSPASFSWVSTGSAGQRYGGEGDGFPSSLGGVASTWGSRMSG